MGGVVDSCVVIAAERRGLSVAALLTRIDQLLPEQELVCSAITAAELVQGVYQGNYAHQSLRMAFVREFLSVMHIVPFSKDTAWIAGQIRGEQASAGNTLPLADSLIAATALEIDYAVLTQNLADFSRIPGLTVIPFNLP